MWLKTLFFATQFSFFFIRGTCAMEKDGDGASVNFFVQN